MATMAEVDEAEKGSESRCLTEKAAAKGSGCLWDSDGLLSDISESGQMAVSSSYCFDDDTNGKAPESSEMFETTTKVSFSPKADDPNPAKSKIKPNPSQIDDPTETTSTSGQDIQAMKLKGVARSTAMISYGSESLHVSDRVPVTPKASETLGDEFSPQTFEPSAMMSGGPGPADVSPREFVSDRAADSTSRLRVSREDNASGYVSSPPACDSAVQSSSSEDIEEVADPDAENNRKDRAALEAMRDSQNLGTVSNKTNQLAFSAAVAQAARVPFVFYTNNVAPPSVSPFFWGQYFDMDLLDKLHNKFADNFRKLVVEFVRYGVVACSRDSFADFFGGEFIEQRIRLSDEEFLKSAIFPIALPSSLVPYPPYPIVYPFSLSFYNLYGDAPFVNSNTVLGALVSQALVSTREARKQLVWKICKRALSRKESEEVDPELLVGHPTAEVSRLIAELFASKYEGVGDGDITAQDFKDMLIGHPNLLKQKTSKKAQEDEDTRDLGRHLPKSKHLHAENESRDGQRMNSKETQSAAVTSADARESGTMTDLIDVATVFTKELYRNELERQALALDTKIRREGLDIYYSGAVYGFGVEGKSYDKLGTRIAAKLSRFRLDLFSDPPISAPVGEHCGNKIQPRTHPDVSDFPKLSRTEARRNGIAADEMPMVRRIVIEEIEAVDGEAIANMSSMMTKKMREKLEDATRGLFGRISRDVSGLQSGVMSATNFLSKWRKQLDSQGREFLGDVYFGRKDNDMGPVTRSAKSAVGASVMRWDDVKSQKSVGVDSSQKGSEREAESLFEKDADEEFQIVKEMGNVCLWFVSVIMLGLEVCGDHSARVCRSFVRGIEVIAIEGDSYRVWMMDRLAVSIMRRILDETRKERAEIILAALSEFSRREVH